MQTNVAWSLVGWWGLLSSTCAILCRAVPLNEGHLPPFFSPLPLNEGLRPPNSRPVSLSPLSEVKPPPLLARGAIQDFSWHGVTQIFFRFYIPHPSNFLTSLKTPPSIPFKLRQKYGLEGYFR